MTSNPNQIVADIIRRIPDLAKESVTNQEITLLAMLQPLALEHLAMKKFIDEIFCETR